MEGLRNFIEVDNHSALDVRHLKESTMSFEVRRPKCEEEGPEVFISEGLTPRTEEVCSKKSCGNFDHIAQTDGDHLWLMLIGMPSARQSTKVLKEESARTCTIATKEMIRAAGVKKPNEPPKAKALWKMKVAKDRREDVLTQSAKTTFWEDEKRDWNCVKSTSKTRLWHWSKL